MHEARGLRRVVSVYFTLELGLGICSVEVVVVTVGCLCNLPSLLSLLAGVIVEVADNIEVSSIYLISF